MRAALRLCLVPYVFLGTRAHEFGLRPVRAYAVMTEVFCEQPLCGEAELAAYCALLVCCLSAAICMGASHYFRILRTVMSQKIFDFPGLRAVALCNQKEQKS